MELYNNTVIVQKLILFLFFGDKYIKNMIIKFGVRWNGTKVVLVGDAHKHT